MLDQFFIVPTLKELNLYRTQIRTPDLRSIIEHSKKGYVAVKTHTACSCNIPATVLLLRIWFEFQVGGVEGGVLWQLECRHDMLGLG